MEFSELPKGVLSADVPVSANDYWRPVVTTLKDGRVVGNLIRTEEAKVYIAYLRDHLGKIVAEPVEGDLFIKTFIWFTSLRPDPTNYLKVFLDACQGILFKNDRQVKGCLLGSGVDKIMPCIEFQLWKYDKLYPGFWDLQIPGTQALHNQIYIEIEQEIENVY